MRSAHERVWMLSPALATAAFFILKLTLGANDPSDSSEMRAAAQGSVAEATEVRVVSQLRRADAPRIRARYALPETEAALVRLLEQEGTVTFLAEEVDVLATPMREFAPIPIQVPASPGPEADEVRPAR